MSEAVQNTEPVPEGYEKVEFGPKTLVIPNEWRVERFGDIFTRRKESIDVDDEKTVRYVGLKNIDSGNLAINGFGEDGRERSSSRAFRDGDILFGKLRPNLEKAAIAPFDGVCSSDIIPIYAEDSTLHEYLPYLMHSKLIRDRVISTMEGTNLPRTSWNDLKSTRIPIPPKNEQRQIVEILSTINKQIQQSNNIYEKAKKTKKGLLSDLIPRGIDDSNRIRPSPEESPEHYKQEKRYKIPIDWEFSQLQELCSEDVTYGIVQAGPHIDGGVPYIKTGDMTNDQLHIESLNRTSTDIAEGYSRSKLQSDELVITIRATVGVIKQIPAELEGANLTQGTARIAPKDSVHNRFLLWAIRSNLVQSMINARVKGSTFNEITLGDLRKVPIPHPSNVDEQEIIADRLDAISEKIDEEKEFEQNLQELKRGLMQDLLTGTKRVNSEQSA